MYERGLFVFRQDLRIYDNTALREAAVLSKKLLFVFIFDEPILAQFSQPDARIGFLIETVFALQQELRNQGSDLLILHGISTQLVQLLIDMYQIDAVFWNKSYGIGSQTRDKEIKDMLGQKSIQFHIYQDYLLVEPNQVETRKVFTPFYHLWQGVVKALPTHYRGLFPPVPSATGNKLDAYVIDEKNESAYMRLGAKKQSFWSRDHCTQQLGKLPIPEYDDRRNMPADVSGTSMLSPYLRFGLVSSRELLNKIIDSTTPGTVWCDEGVSMDKKVFKNSFVSELAWREFRWHIDTYFPETKTVAFQEKRRHIQRQNREDWFLAWKEGRTGYPIVDAGMRQLTQIGRMHGRVRMIVASFLCKDLLIDRVWGEHHFAQLLFDYDAAVNMGNRQWSASVGADPKPLRIFNPILQSQKFDPYAVYIKTWLPELQNVPAEQLHDPLTYTLPWHRPIVNHYETSKQAKELYKGVMQQGLF